MVTACGGIKTSNLRTSGILRSVEWKFCADVYGRTIDAIFKDHKFQKDSFFLDFLTLEDGTDTFSRTVGTELPLSAA
jgi:hypothetical protein